VSIGCRSPLPQLTLDNEFFWTSGADGRLRILGCQSCSALIHPPQPVCRYCHGHALSPVAVSGYATLIGFTVSHRFSHPGLPSPYVVAHVALEEDPRVRLVSNAVGCSPGDLSLGLRMEVTFEQAEDVWLPLFRPAQLGPAQLGPAQLGPGSEQLTGLTTLPEDDPAPGEHWRHVRPMLRTDKFEDKAVITGIGQSQVGRRLMRSPVALAVEAAERAVADAGLTMADIDGLATYPGGIGLNGISEGGVSPLQSALGLNPTWYTSGLETFGPSGPVVSAMMAISAGLARHVLCFRTVWEATYAELVKQGKIRPAGGRATTSQYVFGATSAAHTLAMVAQRYFHKFGAGRQTLGWIALNQRANASVNPTAIYRDPMTMEDYLSARVITTPFGLYDCDVPCDASTAVIVSAADAARDLPARPVCIEAVGTAMTERLEWEQSTLFHEPQVLGQAAHLWTRTSLRPADVDVAELYDGFTINCLSWIEGLGFCGIGEAKDFLDGGKSIARDGILPLNTNGGQLSHGRTHGMGLLHEAVTQLRGEGGARQVAGAKVAVVATGGLAASGVLLLRSPA
jgi:acetyl-CoA acetyltransferase/uncharacterized OB-fold protein